MVQSPSWEANWFVASQEIPRILWKPKVHYRTHKRPPLVPILGQLNPVHIPTSHLLQIHPNIIHSSTPRSPQWSLSLRFPHQDPIRPPLLTHTPHMSSPSHSSLFYHPHNFGWGVRFIIFLNFHPLFNLYFLIKSSHQWTMIGAFVTVRVPQLVTLWFKVVATTKKWRETTSSQSSCLHNPPTAGNKRVHFFPRSAPSNRRVLYMCNRICIVTYKRSFVGFV